jgi:hypothetical protein
MNTPLAKLLRLVATPCGLAGAFLGATLAGLMPSGTGLLGLVVGWLYGIVVGGLMRLFRVPRWAYPLIGLLCGPVPLAVLMKSTSTEDERGAVLLGLLAGLALGFVEWAHASFRARPPAGAGPESGFVDADPPSR